LDENLDKYLENTEDSQFSDEEGNNIVLNDDDEETTKKKKRNANKRGTSNF